MGQSRGFCRGDAAIPGRPIDDAAPYRDGWIFRVGAEKAGLRGREAHPTVIASSTCDEAIHLSAGKGGLLRFSRNDAGEAGPGMHSSPTSPPMPAFQGCEPAARRLLPI